jgi:hypothetical protein
MATAQGLDLWLVMMKGAAPLAQELMHGHVAQQVACNVTLFDDPESTSPESGEGCNLQIRGLLESKKGFLELCN